MPKELTITIHGRPGSGKSAIAQLLAEFLHDKGFSGVTLIEDEHPLRSADDLTRILTAIATADTKITVIGQQLSRSGSQT